MISAPLSPKRGRESRERREGCVTVTGAVADSVSCLGSKEERNQLEGRKTEILIVRQTSKGKWQTPYNLRIGLMQPTVVT